MYIEVERTKVAIQDDQFIGTSLVSYCARSKEYLF